MQWTSEQNQDWFVWFHPMDVHDPYEAPEEYQLQYLDESIPRRRSQSLATKAVHHPEEMTEVEWQLQQQLYKAECSYLDDQLRRLFKSLGETQQDTLVVFTADHGDMHGEHGRGGHPQEFWEEVIHVPLAIDVPGRDATTIDGQVELIDVPPTILDALDIDVPTYWDGQSLWPQIDDDANPREHAFIDVGAELDRQHAGVRRADGWKLMRHEGTEWLFDLSMNPEEDERDDRQESEPDIYDELSAALDEHLDEMETRRKHGPTGIEDEEMIEDHLRELGYLE
jgi:arylsulfatase A-like enzyme